MNRFDKEYRDNRRRFRESDSFDENYFDEERGSKWPHHYSYGRMPGVNRFGEERIHHDHLQDDQYKKGYDPTYEDEYGMRHPYEHGGRSNRWSDDIRSEASRESHYGKGPKGYRRSPDRILDEACEVLAQDFEVDASDVEVNFKDGILYLKGEVATRNEKRRAELLVEDLPGVEDVHNLLRVKRLNVEGWIPGVGNVENEI
jgi:hypothetical protein